MYTASALDWSPYRTVENSVLTAPGLMAVTRMGVCARSCRADVVKASIACLLAQYTLPPWYAS